MVVAIGDHAVDLEAARRLGHLDLPPDATTGTLDRLLATGLGSVRDAVRALLDDPPSPVGGWLVEREALAMHLPFTVADYVDFYASETHATAVGRLFRPDDDPLPPAWRHLPIGYHGRAGTVVVSGTPVRRPAGQRVDGDRVTFGPTRKLDFELEVGAVIGRPATGPVPTGRALDHVAGLVLLNDWSARDVQAFEYRPLGPMLGKAFATTISPWVVTTEALAPFRTAPPAQDPTPLPHLTPAGDAFDVWVTAAIDGTTVSEASLAGMYWTIAQQIAHLTHGGAALRTGDLLGSGTISDPGPGGAGSLLEATHDGRDRVTAGSDTRAWLEDGDTVTLRGHAARDDIHIGFGECTGTVLANGHDDEGGGRP